MTRRLFCVLARPLPALSEVKILLFARLLGKRSFCIPQLGEIQAIMGEAIAAEEGQTQQACEGILYINKILEEGGAIQ